MKLEAKGISECTDVPEVWQRIVDASPDAWFFHTWTMREFNLCAGKPYGARDLSFFICDAGTPIGVAPLVVQKSATSEPVAAYYSGILPWPVCTEASRTEEFEDLAFQEIERRAKAAGVTRVIERFYPSADRGSDDARTARVADAFKYTRTPLHSHMVRIEARTLSNVRERYIRYHKKYSPEFALEIADRDDVTDELAMQYMQLHTKDAGKQVRSEESYQRQADLARRGEAFYVIARSIENKVIVGGLLVSCYKGAAYDNSVAVDPNYANRYVGHLLKWRAIEELQKRNIATYELGSVASGSVSGKERGINHFKEGWSRGNTRTLWHLEKRYR